MANWLTAVGFCEQQMLLRILKSWRALGGQKLLTALAHWESSQSGLGPAFRWWRRVVLHLHDADHVAQQHRQQHACRAAFQASHFDDQLHVSADSCDSCSQHALLSTTAHAILKTKYGSSLPSIHSRLAACLMPRHAAPSEPLCPANLFAHPTLSINV